MGLAPDLGAVEVVPGFTNAPIAGLSAVYLSSVAWGDYDNDGDLDLLLTGTNDGTNGIARIYRNDGGLFTNLNAPLTGVHRGGAAWVAGPYRQ